MWPTFRVVLAGQEEEEMIGLLEQQLEQVSHRIWIADLRLMTLAFIHCNRCFFE